MELKTTINTQSVQVEFCGVSFCARLRQADLSDQYQDAKIVFSLISSIVDADEITVNQLYWTISKVCSLICASKDMQLPPRIYEGLPRSGLLTALRSKPHNFISSSARGFVGFVAVSGTHNAAVYSLLRHLADRLILRHVFSCCAALQARRASDSVPCESRQQTQK